MALTGYPKTYLSPHIIVHSDTGTMSKISGIYDMIKFTSDVPEDHIEVTVGHHDSSGTNTTVAAAMTAGDVLEGPFTSVEVTTGHAGGELWIYERASVTS
tara:strand:- start:1407 stop:1706 length:300 start_codon:yes stop_codon:yes gene_type:complete